MTAPQAKNRVAPWKPPPRGGRGVFEIFLTKKTGTCVPENDRVDFPRTLRLRESISAPRTAGTCTRTPQQLLPISCTPFFVTAYQREHSDITTYPSIL